MSTPLLEQALAAIRARRETALALGIELVGVVGSVARDEAGPESDVDVAYEIVGKPSLFDLGGVLTELQEDLNRRVDLVDLHRIKPMFQEDIERDLVRA